MGKAHPAPPDPPPLAFLQRQQNFPKRERRPTQTGPLSSRRAAAGPCEAGAGLPEGSLQLERVEYREQQSQGYCKLAGRLLSAGRSQSKQKEPNWPFGQAPGSQPPESAALKTKSRAAPEGKPEQPSQSASLLSFFFPPAEFRNTN